MNNSKIGVTVIKKLFDKLLNKPEKIEDYGTGLKIGQKYLIIPKNRSLHTEYVCVLELAKIEKLKSDESIILLFYKNPKDWVLYSMQEQNALIVYNFDDLDLVKVDKRR